jgi:hypothetical protein
MFQEEVATIREALCLKDEDDLGLEDDEISYQDYLIRWEKREYRNYLAGLSVKWGGHGKDEE